MTPKGIVVAGHPETAAAAAAMLAEGGNAFDAALAALSAACVAEPVLASLGGGGFLLARPSAGGAATPGNGAPVLYDFFTQTPKTRQDPAEMDFFPVVADFGPTIQEFHIGMGSIATPGLVRGLFRIHRDLCSMPMARIVEPAIGLARKGIRINRLQAYIMDIVGAIYLHGEASRKVFGSRKHSGRLIGEGEVLAFPGLADTLDALAREGEDLFYRGDIARALVAACREGGGNLTRDDLESYGVVKRQPLELAYREARLYTNPPPSTGGLLIGFALELLKGASLDETRFGSESHLLRLANAMALTNKARIDSGLDGSESAATAMLAPWFLAVYRDQVMGRPSFMRGTTHISVIDAAGNAAALTISNGEGCGFVIPGTDVMINNMLGEADTQPHGFHRWRPDTRISSMMAPTLVTEAEGATIALGSGGSNRLRTAMLQVILNLLEFAMPIDEAVAAPRIHVEDGLLSLEPGFGEPEMSALRRVFPEIKMWGEKNLFFGGVHAARAQKGLFTGGGDSRRGGVTLAV